jgi:hypothetical protein
MFVDTGVRNNAIVDPSFTPSSRTIILVIGTPSRSPFEENSAAFARLAANCDGNRRSQRSMHRRRRALRNFQRCGERPRRGEL